MSKVTYVAIIRRSYQSSAGANLSRVEPMMCRGDTPSNAILDLSARVAKRRWATQSLDVLLLVKIEGEEAIPLVLEGDTWRGLRCSSLLTT